MIDNRAFMVVIPAGFEMWLRIRPVITAILMDQSIRAGG